MLSEVLAEPLHPTLAGFRVLPYRDLPKHRKVDFRLRGNDKWAVMIGKGILARVNPPGRAGMTSSVYSDP
ncbi:MAG: hypothetical protein CVT49_02015 [candidate division Zixibacteria bacterium HGW-Zixibacteria-1]|nr:MAG: hypothetical protein CVT49_02015 [candidate division Zixibacteria bacterium HGW-Zixibacteria-1]